MKFRNQLFDFEGGDGSLQEVHAKIDVKSVKKFHVKLYYEVSSGLRNLWRGLLHKSNSIWYKNG